ncbi:MAG: N-acetyltransferase [Bacteroidota bacterium]
MEILIRQEKKEDYLTVHNVVQAAFANDPHGDHTEHLLVERLRQSAAFIPELSLVALNEDKIVGHILLTKIKINNDQESFPSLSLAPVSVHPEFQNMGIGGKLIIEAHQISRRLGHNSVIVLGHENYYPRFGYRKASDFKIRLPFEARDENCMAIELIENGLSGVSGTVEYPKAFFE